MPSGEHLPDPRPIVATGADGTARIAGWRCSACGAPRATAAPWCPRCRGSLTPQGFGPRGTVWSATVMRVPLPGRTPPWGLVYVDLDDGPRVLGHLAGDLDRPPTAGTPIVLVGRTHQGDPLFAPEAA